MTDKREGRSMTPEPSGKPRKRTSSHPTSKRRNQRQKANQKAARGESASASGVIATTPEMGRAGRDEYLKATTPVHGSRVPKGQSGAGGECASHLLRSM